MKERQVNYNAHLVTYLESQEKISVHLFENITSL